MLRQPSTDAHDAAVRWRQLVDLMARSGPGADSASASEAIAAIRADAPRVDEALRAAAARAIAALPLPLALLECFVADRLAVSAPILAAASLDLAQWRALLANADDETQSFITTLHPQLIDQPPAERIEPKVEPGPAPTLREMIQRIERRRRPRGAAQTRGSAQPASVDAEFDRASLFRWECGPSGDIGWVDGAPRGALIGRSIARSSDENGDHFDASGVRAFVRRAPFRDATLVLGGAGPVAGKWKMSAVPAFDPVDGRFAGYRGVALREEPAAAARPSAQSQAAPALDGDSLRELVHEIKTPLNAIIGFAEIIDGQYLGPAGRRYRDRATLIASQARLLLTAIDDLDFAAKLHSGGQAANGSVDLAEVVRLAAEKVRARPGSGGAAVALGIGEARVRAAVDAELAARIVERLIAAATVQAAEGEVLDVTVQQRSGKASVSIAVPAALKGQSDRQIFADPALDQGDLSGLFSLRLARGLARIARASLTLSSGRLKLSFVAA